MKTEPKEYCIFRIEDNKLMESDLTHSKSIKVRNELNNTYGYLYGNGITKNYKQIMKDKRKIPFDFWNYGVNPITGYTRSDKTLNQKRRRDKRKTLNNVNTK